MNQKHNLSLTGLKGIFICCIVITHTLPETPLFNSIPGSAFLKLYGGLLGNIMFFMLSGYLISLGYQQRIRNRQLCFRDFFMRRLSKLYPMYIISNLMAFPTHIAFFGASAFNLKRIVMTVLLQSGGGLDPVFPYNGPTWFLSALFVCYVLYYVIAFHAKHTTQYRCFIGAGIVLGYTLNLYTLNIPFCFNQNGFAYMSFFIGCALAEILPQLSHKVRVVSEPFGFSFLVFSLFLLMRYGVEIISGSVGTAFAFVICPLILMLASGNNLISKILATKPFAFWGTVSVSVYFWHMVIYNYVCLAFQIDPNHYLLPNGLFALYLALMIPASIGLYYVFHKKGHL